MSYLLKTHVRQLVFFGFFGSIGAIIDICSLIFYVEIIQISPRWGFMCSAFTAMIFIFFVNKFITFKNTDTKIIKQSVKFLLVYIPATVLNGIGSSFFLWLGFTYIIAKIITILCIALLNYTLSHVYIFKK